MAKKVSQSVSAKMRSIQNKNTVDVNLKSTEAAIATDQQARLVNTFVTHTSAVVTPTTGSAQSAWQPVPEGMTEFINNITMDANLATIYAFVEWSEDGTARSGKTEPSTAATANGTARTSNNWLAVGGSFYKVSVYNGDAAPHTCSANIKFRS